MKETKDILIVTIVTLLIMVFFASMHTEDIPRNSEDIDRCYGYDC